MKVHIETHGCKLNTADSQRLAAEFVRNGYEISRGSEDPDVFVLNSCTVTHVADKKARQSLNKARREFPDAVIVAAGCYAERAEQEIHEFESVDLVVPNARKSELVSMVNSRVDFETPNTAESTDPVLLGRTRAAVKIQEGCDQVCAYCIVPKVRGRERSVPIEVITTQIQDIFMTGCPEVILTGTQLGSYGFDLEQTNLVELIRKILSETDVPRLRVSSLQPHEITSDLLDLWNNEGAGRLAPHFHIPLQSGSDRILKLMRRRYTRDEYQRAVELVREQVHGASITADVIAGFPGETDQDHEDSVEALKRAEPADAHVFPYSIRSGTSAAYLNEQLDPTVKQRRAEELRTIADEFAKQHRKSFVGDTRTVLWEGQGGLTGLTDNYLRVRVAPEFALGDGVLKSGSRDGLIEPVKLIRLEGMQLIGLPV